MIYIPKDTRRDVRLVIKSMRHKQALVSKAATWLDAAGEHTVGASAWRKRRAYMLAEEALWDALDESERYDKHELDAAADPDGTAQRPDDWMNGGEA